MKFSSPFLSSLKSRWQDKLFLCALTLHEQDEATRLREGNGERNQKLEATYGAGRHDVERTA